MKRPKMLNLVTIFTYFAISTSLFAQEAGGEMSAGSAFAKQLPLLILFGALFYFLIIAPQRKQQKKHAELMNQLKRGDEVVTAAGIIGTIQGINDRVVSLEVSPGTEIKVIKSQVQGLLRNALAQAEGSKS